MGVHGHGPVSNAAMRLTDLAHNTNDLWEWCDALNIDTSDAPDDDHRDYLRQLIIDHFATLANER